MKIKPEVRWISLWLVLTAAACPGGRMGGDATRFSFRGAPGADAWVNTCIRRFFTNRVDEGATYALEYQAIADSWLHDAFMGGRLIQERKRTRLLDTPLSVEGYVSAQQHISSSQDDGWPFPVWPQVPGETGYEGTTFGWHFYDQPQEWEIVLRHHVNPAPGSPPFLGKGARAAWELTDLDDHGLDAGRHAWTLAPAGKLPTLTGPEEVKLDAFNCPYIQIRMKAAGLRDACMDWRRAGDEDWSASRRMYFRPETTPHSATTGMRHAELPLHRHPAWTGTIERIRFRFPEIAQDRPFFIRSIFTHWDTRHLVNNAIYIKAAWEHFRWTGDLDFLRVMLPRMRRALRFMMDEGHARELNHIRCTWPGHDGRPGFTVHDDGSKTPHPGHGKGGSYWDLLPFGWDDLYTTTHYYAALRAMAELEEAADAHPGWAIPDGFAAFDPAALRTHAAAVKETVNRKFWDREDGRFVGCIDRDGVAHDYGFTFVNLEAIHYGIATEPHAERIMTWIEGDRIVEGDTATGEDIYAYRLAPRATTRRNIDWYTFSWFSPEVNPFGGQIQDGGAVLGFSFYDIMSRIRTLGADNAWTRLMEIRAWDEEVQAYGGYRKYYAEGRGGTTLQGGGTAGGIGIDFEFTESSMLAAVVPLGFMGLQPDGDTLHIEPRLPEACPAMRVRNLRYRGVPLDITVAPGRAAVELPRHPPKPIRITLGETTRVLTQPGIARFSR
ncbi:glycosyl hydrolase family 65 protein [Kiritimatiella glycovorans]|uniref:Glycoside hydrolase family protein n=1 Tax=Kiritimatiella glycovorans TaxID=1307763 RepID=A0A0G3EMT5_9BACT|nr:glycosyl hydrolase family 65 protein [Kiritimatiella glycovorans]AKJ65424.1 Glycoside hydrolase family protein [Kiritimatiella glycovorans]